MDTVPVQDSNNITMEEFIGSSRLNARLANTMAQLESMVNQAGARIQQLETENAQLRGEDQDAESPLSAVPNP